MSTADETLFPGFTTTRIPTAEADILVRHGGSGPPVVLLHGHPRTSATWHRVAPLLVERGFTVICPDLRGYGRSRGPAPTADHSAHSKRAIARDIRTVAERLGHERFRLVGHDRGSYVALRLALDHPEAVAQVALLDCLPITEHLRRCDATFAAHWWHWFFFAQPDIPERVIGADSRCPRSCCGRNATISRSCTATPLRIWRDWADDVRGHGIDSGHHMAEEAPEPLAAALAGFFGATPPPRT